MRSPYRPLPAAFGAGVLVLCASTSVFASDRVARIVGVLFALAAVPLLWTLARHFASRSVFEQVQLEALGPVALGGTAALQLVLVPRRPLRLTGNSTMTVTCVERAVYSAGTSSRTYENAIFQREYPLELPPVLSSPVEQRLTLPIPSDIPPTWSGKSNWFLTRVEVRVDVGHWPDLQLDTTLEVLPEVAP